jgi:hypothetical protein
MLNTTINTTMNAPASGIIQKSNKDSYFLRMHKDSQRSKELFVDKPKYEDQPVAVLQVLLMDEKYLMVEVVPADKL